MVISLYLVIGLICAILLGIMVFLGDMGGDVDVDVDADIDLGFGDFGGAGVSPLSGPVILGFGTFFGVSGFIFEELGYGQLIIPVLAVLVGAAGSGAIYFGFVRVLAKSQATTQVNIKDLIGMDAEITISIKPGAPGQIMVITEERGRTLVSAFADDEIPTNTMVRIEGTMANGVKVKRKGGM